ncbi:MAG TPA: selenocysteine-specific translation elongation factor [Gemmatimonadota bacterium]|nr:selenocysteine-specific translation elongation factor [Gemmatimonadota bacterium]
MTRGRVVGTAGHIDHGKTELVRALTGVWTDRLPAERERGISIDLGFAPLELGEGAPPASVVDVPGHEGFIKNMVAGATGIDAVLLVVAADEGMMPQSREHLLVLTALGVERGVVAVTKADLVEPEWAELVAESVREELAGTVLAGAPIVVCSARTGEGVERVRAALGEAVAGAEPARRAHLPFRLPVDRAFGVAGVGTVATGTVWSGEVETGGVVALFPAEARRPVRPVETRVRSIQVHGAAVERAGAGQRAALGLAGADTASAGRGAVLADPSRPWRMVKRVDARCALASSAPRPLPRGARVRVHHATREVMARVWWYDRNTLEPGEEADARLTLEAPIVPAAGDRLVLRAYSPVTTIGGGTILALDPPRERGAARAERGRRLAEMADAPEEARLVLALEAAGGIGIPHAALAIETGVEPGEPPAGIEIHGGRWFAASARVRAMERIERALAEHHAREPLQPGLPLEAARRAARPADPALVEAAIEALEREDRARRRGTVLALAGHRAQLPEGERELVARLQARLSEAALEPPETVALASDLRVETRRLRELLAHLEREGALVKLASDWYADAAAVERAREAVVERLEAEGAVEVGAFRELLGVSRKYLIPLLEYLDREGVTRREGNRRVRA